MPTVPVKPKLKFTTSSTTPLAPIGGTQTSTPSTLPPAPQANISPSPNGLIGPINSGNVQTPFAKSQAPVQGPVQPVVTQQAPTQSIGDDFLTDEQRAAVAGAKASIGGINAQPTQPQTPGTFTTPSGAVVDAQGNVISTPSTPSTPQTPPSQTIGSGTFVMKDGKLVPADPNTGIPIEDKTTTAPVPPVVPPETQAAVAAAEKAVQDALKISPEQLSTQADIDKLNESLRKAFVNIEDQAIPLDFITGQMASVERRALSLAEPLERRAARLQAARTSSLTASRFALDRADRAVDIARGEHKTATEAAKALEDDIDAIANAALELGATPQQIQSISRAKTVDEARRLAADIGLFGGSEAEGGFTLSPGQVRFDAQGNQIATGGARPATDAEIKRSLEKGEADKASLETQTTIIANINSLLLDPNLAAVIGKSRFGIGARTAGTASAKNLFKQLKALTSLAERGKLKGSGTISDFEAQMLSDSATALNGAIDDDGRVALGDDEVIQALKNIRGVMLSKSGNLVDVTVTDQSGESKIAENATSEELQAWTNQGLVINYN